MMKSGYNLFDRYFESGFRHAKITPEEYRDLLKASDVEDLDEFIKERKLHGIKLILIDKKGKVIRWPENVKTKRKNNKK